MDALDANDLRVALALSPAQKLTQALDMMSSGIRLKRAALQHRFPGADAAEIERMLTVWLTQDG